MAVRLMLLIRSLPNDIDNNIHGLLSINKLKLK